MTGTAFAILAMFCLIFLLSFLLLAASRQYWIRQLTVLVTQSKAKPPQHQIQAAAQWHTMHIVHAMHIVHTVNIVHTLNNGTWEGTLFIIIGQLFYWYYTYKAWIKKALMLTKTNSRLGYSHKLVRLEKGWQVKF